MMAVDDLLDWRVEFGPIDAELECRPVDIKTVSKAMLPDSPAILGVNDAGVWIRSKASRQGTHAYCPAEAFPEFECSTAGAVVVSPSQVSTLRSATLSTDPARVSVSLNDERLTVRANEFGGTVPTPTPTRDAGQHRKIAERDLSAIHDQHSAAARVADCQFEDFLNGKANAPDAEVTLTSDGASVTTPFGDVHWSWEESTGSGKATYRRQEFLDAFDRFNPVESTPRFAWGDNKTAAMIFYGESWHTIGYVTPVQNSSTDTSRRQDVSATITRHCPECGSRVEHDSTTGNWTCQFPKCGFRAITLE